MSVRVCWTAAALVAAAVAGCAEKAAVPEKQKTVPVTGKITVRGKPLGDVDVSFQSADGKVSARGKTDASGLFTLTTYASGDGAPVGLYKVTVSVNTTKVSSDGVILPLPLDADGNPLPSAAGKSPIPPKYSSVSSTDLSADVKSEGSNQFSFDLK